MLAQARLVPAVDRLASDHQRERTVQTRTAAAGCPPRLLTRRELAQLLLISPRTLDRRRGAGEILDPIPGTGQPRWLAEEAWAWIMAGRPPADAWRRRPIRR
jgi:hypothetical protein